MCVCKLSNSFAEMRASCIKICRMLLNFRKCVHFTALRKNLLNELTCIQLHNDYVHGKHACKLGDFPLASFCDWSLENTVLLLLLCIFITHFSASFPIVSIIRINCRIFSTRKTIEIIQSQNLQSFHQQKLLSIISSMKVTSERILPTKQRINNNFKIFVKDL